LVALFGALDTVVHLADPLLAGVAASWQRSS
jgi:hypothetical protein